GCCDEAPAVRLDDPAGRAAAVRAGVRQPLSELPVEGAVPLQPDQRDPRVRRLHADTRGADDGDAPIALDREAGGSFVATPEVDDADAVADESTVGSLIAPAPSDSAVPRHVIMDAVTAVA